MIIANTWSAVVIDPAGKAVMEHYDVEGAFVHDVDLSSATAMKDRELDPAELDRLLRNAFEATQHRWDREGRPTEFELKHRTEQLEGARARLLRESRGD